MNRIYKTVWNAVRRCLVVVNEAAMKQGSSTLGGGGSLARSLTVGFLGAFFAGQSLASISAVPATLTGNQQDNLYRNTAVSGGTNLTFTSTTQF